MATVTVSLPADGSTGTVSQYNTPLTTIVNEFNGNIDNANIKSGAAIATSKLADDSGITSAKVATGMPVQVVATVTGAVATGTTTIPGDDTIPQNTEGDQYMSLAITPKSATNRLYIEVKAQLSNSLGATDIIGAIFQDSTANALTAGWTTQAGTTYKSILVLGYDMVAGTTSSTTFKFRAGCVSASTTTFNGNSGVRLLGGVMSSYIKITEYKA